MNPPSTEAALKRLRTIWDDRLITFEDIEQELEQARTEGRQQAVREIVDAVEDGDPDGIVPRFYAVIGRIRAGLNASESLPARRFDNPSRCGWCGSKGEHLPDCDAPHLTGQPPEASDA